MSAGKLASKYISSAEDVLRKLEITDTHVAIGFSRVQDIFSMARDYLEDAKYYLEKKEFEVSLTSVAYCEGLLDGAKTLGIVKFEWPSREETKKRVVLASGVFDLLHLGHVRFLEEAKKAGGSNAELVVIIARDSTVKKRKNEKPVMSEKQRCALVASLRVVDKAILGYKRFNVAKVVERISPDVVAFGHDQREMEEAVRNYVNLRGLNIKVVRIEKFSSDELDSSSEIKQRIISDYER